ncbi:MAG TPA: NAD+ synthase [Candidatus Sulfomarinibacteraceae bacterium]|nr:NAD+ synthase [Candidatus Sulfomarinibacteraceae bacterium]
MRIAIAQLDYTIGAFDANFELMAAAVAGARGRGAELVVFSELATVGYPPGDLLERPDFVSRNLVQLDRVAALSDDELGLVVGYVDRNPSGRGKGLLNSAALCLGGRPVARYHKCLLPTYDVFDEARHFEPGGPAKPLLFKGVRLGVSVCEDVWADPDLDGRSLYHRDPVLEQVEAGAELLINISASPYELGKAAQRRDLVRRYAAQSGRFFVYANQVGGNDELVFDGHSIVVDPTGRVVVRCRDFAPDLVVADVPVGADSGAMGELREVAGCLEEEALRALELGLRDYVAKTGFASVLLGLSGGIDSALTAAIAARALGPERVLAVALPTRFSSRASLEDAEALAANLGIELRVIPIDDIFQAYLDGLAPTFDGLPPDVTEENIQSRIRCGVLMALSNKLGPLLLTTGNKSELAVGYATLYGDMAGGLAVISDVPKTLVYGLAEHLNRDREVIPRSTIDKAPSAELRPDQTDQDTLPPYDQLDRVVEGYVERNQSVDELVAGGLERSVVEQVVRMVDRSEYKRRQAAPGIKITAKAFGAGRRYPIAADYAGLHRRRG